MNPRERDALLKLALAEDAARHDVTSRSVIPQNSRIKAAIMAKEPGILAGIDVAARIFKLQDSTLSARAVKKDGSAIKSGQTVLTVEGSARSILSAERTALNLLGHLSGVATLTRQFVLRSRPHRVEIFDTRKTLPGLRLLEKRAVRLGGGHNHRADLREAILIKTNHVRALAHAMGQGARGRGRIIAEAIRHVRRVRPGQFLEVEVANLEEYTAALSGDPEAILLDNWPLADIRKAVRLRALAPRPAPLAPILEVSGGVTLENVRAIAATGIDRISIGRLTHSAPSLDVSLIVDQ